ncbi:unnamed protein product [Rotaria magnacalcarata]|uniref:Uncharacterized protein n=2 Tax=Rotaria magnacalcarata TaxID=392030 RepID=A0A815SW57_9BILA|nr:unnamed protein product [Rotaria magnacalcarata]CAF3829922.1 unnamed protein product [Rotaria magnacalcarata]CAF4095875.1 unnamed protein product [Rotaria magnacalcarata]CAF4117191.1 unnamed protein product [Rotaria magnacalcarata]CAF4132487.1 unnamed protein product [Rotaria magnacalcarata]
MAKLKICYLNIFQSHLFPLTTLLNENNESLEIYQTKLNIAMIICLINLKIKQIVEIGSGTGIVGLQLCALGGNHVLTGKAQSKTLFLADDLNEKDDDFQNLDFVIVANCVYHSIEFDQLIKTICNLCPEDSHTCLLCCYELRKDDIRQLVNELHEKLIKKHFLFNLLNRKKNSNGISL